MAKSLDAFLHLKKMFEKLIGTLKWFDITYAMVRPFDQNNLACNVYDDIINEFLYVYE